MAVETASAETIALPYPYLLYCGRIDSSKGCDRLLDWFRQWKQQNPSPVRLVLTLEETFQAARRTSARVHIRSGFDPSGGIVFQDIDADFLVGAYADIAARVLHNLVRRIADL